MSSVVQKSVLFLVSSKWWNRGISNVSTITATSKMYFLASMRGLKRKIKAFQQTALFLHARERKKTVFLCGCGWPLLNTE